jgi:hypothetical protein
VTGGLLRCWEDGEDDMSSINSNTGTCMNADVSKEMATPLDVPESPECGELLSFGVQVTLSCDARLPESEHIRVFKIVHFFSDVMADMRLQFSCQATENAHLESRQEPDFFKNAAMVCDGRKGPVDLKETVIRAEFFGIVGDSHCASNPGAKVRARSVLRTLGASA